MPSAHALRALRPRLLGVGHGALLPDPEAAMDRAIAVAGRRWLEAAYGA